MVHEFRATLCRSDESGIVIRLIGMCWELHSLDLVRHKIDPDHYRALTPDALPRFCAVEIRLGGEVARRTLRLRAGGGV